MTVVLCPGTASALRGNTVLTKLRLEYCHIDAEGISLLAKALCDIKTLRELNLSYNAVGSESVEHLGELSGGVWGYGLTCNIRSVSVLHPTGRCLHVVQNVSIKMSILDGAMLLF